MAGDPDVFTPLIRIVHISGVPVGADALTDAQDSERGLLDETDRTDATSQMRRLLAAGYQGAFSYECTAFAVRNREDPKAEIAASIDYLRRELGTV